MTTDLTVTITLLFKSVTWDGALVFWCAESRGGGLGAGTVQAARSGRRAGARGRDAAAAAGAGAVQCLRGDDPPPGAGEGTAASSPGVCHAHHALPRHAPPSRHPGPTAGVPLPAAEPGGHAWQQQLPARSARGEHRPTDLRPLTQAGIAGQPREQQWVPSCSRGFTHWAELLLQFLFFLLTGFLHKAKASKIVAKTSNHKKTTKS